MVLQRFSLNKHQGFSLLEVLVAMSILAIALAAVSKTLVTQIDSATYLQDKTLAHWVAMNQLTRLRLDPRLARLGKRSGRSLMGQRDWDWQLIVTDTPVAGLRQVDIRVFMPQENKNLLSKPNSIVSLRGFVGT